MNKINVAIYIVFITLRYYYGYTCFGIGLFDFES